MHSLLANEETVLDVRVVAVNEITGQETMIATLESAFEIKPH